VLTLAYFVLVGASLAWLDSWMLAAIAVAVVAARMLAKLGANVAFAPPSALSPD
jgi:hypothetical protein